MSEDRKVRLACSHGPDIHFVGRIVKEFTTQNKAGSKDRWTELRLWETEGGAWVAENVGCSSRDGEGTIREARIIPVGMDLESSRIAAMEGWGWTSAAKAFARELGWDMIRRVA